MIDRINQFCFQTSGRTEIKFGLVHDQWLAENGWAMVKIQWQSGGSTVEKLANVSFGLDRIDSFQKWIKNVELANSDYDNKVKPMDSFCDVCGCIPCDCADREAPSGSYKY